MKVLPEIYTCQRCSSCNVRRLQHMISDNVLGRDGGTSARISVPHHIDARQLGIVVGEHDKIRDSTRLWQLHGDIFYRLVVDLILCRLKQAPAIIHQRDLIACVVVVASIRLQSASYFEI